VKKQQATKPNNLVAKHAMKFNKAAVMRDRKNDYQRTDKHKKGESE
jgi:hypothetical protein